MSLRALSGKEEEALAAARTQKGLKGETDDRGGTGGREGLEGPRLIAGHSRTCSDHTPVG